MVPELPAGTPVRVCRKLTYGLLRQGMLGQVVAHCTAPRDPNEPRRPFEYGTFAAPYRDYCYFVVSTGVRQWIWAADLEAGPEITASFIAYRMGVLPD